MYIDYLTYLHPKYHYGLNHIFLGTKEWKRAPCTTLLDPTIAFLLPKFPAETHFCSKCYGQSFELFIVLNTTLQHTYQFHFDLFGSILSHYAKRNRCCSFKVELRHLHMKETFVMYYEDSCGTFEVHYATASTHLYGSPFNKRKFQNQKH